MQFSPGYRLGTYEILAAIGAGGMGEVYRARDIKLNRDVAIKILPESFALDRDRLARFDREAQVLASLNFPHIAAIYGVEERALIMELVEGPTLAERIAQGPIPLEEVLPIAKQIADALEYAHERGVVHRDLKPANIKVSGEGIVKVLDFGLAKALITEAARGVTNTSPTLTIHASAAGIILGTAAYMSPEQAKGKPVDRRADIWAFGVVLYEMLTARPLYTGENVSETLAAVIMKEPDLAGLPANTPPALRKLLRRALDRDPRQRLQAIAEARIVLEQAMRGEEGDGTPAPVKAPAGRSAVLPWAAAGLLLVAALVLAVGLWRATRPLNRPLLSLSVDLGPEAMTGPQTTAVLSPDGTRMVYPVRSADGKQALAVRPLNQARGSVLAGTEGGINPFFSPDGQWIGFFGGGKMKKISVTGGAAVALCDAVTGRGGSWSEDGYIVATLSNNAGLARIPDSGGTPQLLTKPGETGDVTHRWPQLLPGGRGVLFTAHTRLGNYDEARISAFEFKTARQRTVVPGAYFGRYLPTGHLVYIHQGTVFGVPFDPVRLELKGAPMPLVEGVAGAVSLGGGQYDFSETGTFVYLSGRPESGGAWHVVSVSADGKAEPVIGAPGPYINPRLSPDGKRLALAVGLGVADIWIYGLHGEALVRLTFDGSSHGPIWTPDGKHIIYFTQDQGIFRIMWIRADGAGEPQRLFESKEFVATHSISPDGRRVAFTAITAETRSDIWTLPLDMTDPEHPKAGKPEVFLSTPASELYPAFSPDGHWIVFASNETGSFEIYVRPVSGGGKWQVSTAGGNNPVWSPAGRQLFYVDPQRRITVVDYTDGGNSFQRGNPRLWEEKPIVSATPSGGSLMDVMPDGKRIVVLAEPGDSEERKENLHLTFLVNFFDEVRRRMPAGGK